MAVAACSSPAPTTTTTNTTTTTTNRATTPANTTNTSTTTNTNTTSAANNTSSSSSEASAKQDFTLVNQTGVTIDKVFISPHDSNDWEEDILGQDVLNNGESVDIKFHRSEKADIWDLRIEDKQGGFIEWENLNLPKIDKLTLHYKDGKATAVPE